MDIMGTKIYSDSLATAIRDDYQKLIGFGIADQETEEIILKAYKGIHENEAYHSIFWIALAYTEWRLGRLSDRVKAKAIEVIDSGEDLKKWKKVVDLEPRLKKDNAALMAKIFSSLADRSKRNPENKTDHPYEDQDYYNDNVNHLVNFSKTLSGTDNHNAEEPLDLSDDPFTYGIFRINGSAKKKLELRKKELQDFRTMINEVLPKKKVSKPYYTESPWKVGDCFSFQLSELTGDHALLNGQWVAVRVIRIQQTPVISFLPDLAQDDDIYVSFYDYLGDHAPSAEEIKNADYMPISIFKGLGNKLEDHKGLHLSLYGRKRKLKEWNWILVDHNEQFAQDHPDFFKDGVFSAMICGIDVLSLFFARAFSSIKKIGPRN